MVLADHQRKLPAVIYWGEQLPADEDLPLLAAQSQPDRTVGMLECIQPLSICPLQADVFAGQCGLQIRDAEGNILTPSLMLDEVTRQDNGLTISASDTALGIRYQASFCAHPHSHIIESSAWIHSSQPIRLDWLAAPVLPAPSASCEILEPSGHWCGEFQLVAHPWGAGMCLRENLTGRSGHEHFPALLIPEQGCTNTRGNAYVLQYAWSGGHRMLAEELADGRRQVQFGHAFASERELACRFTTAPLYAVFSDQGLNGCAIAMQRHLRNQVIRWRAPATQRPVHYNCWEAVYFNHDMPRLLHIAERAADLGAECFVLDDGWFHQRRDETTALGDWWVDEQKYPDGLQPLIDHIHHLGMRFGLWCEPEMISPQSDTCRKHPDWILGGSHQPLMRHQLVLDMAREDVREYLYDRLCALLDHYPIACLKWDHNRTLPISDARQIRGTYALLDALEQRYPQIEIESCAAGGGRADAGMLSRCQRVWLSDSNDALERLRIQHNAALFLPGAVCGSHVGPRLCHTSGRILDIRLRAWTAAQRHLGYELDPDELTDEEFACLKRVTAWWKANRSWMMQADILRLDTYDPSLLAEQQLAEDGRQFMLFATRMVSSSQILPRPLRCAGLQRDAHYRLALVDAEDVSHLSFGQVPISREGVTASGAWLMQHGVQLPVTTPQSILVIEGKRV